MEMERFKMNIKNDTSQKDIDEMVQRYFSSPSAMVYCHKLGINDDMAKANITKIIDFVDDIEFCSTKCQGVKNCQKEHPLMCCKIDYKNGMIIRQIVPCNKCIQYQAFVQRFFVHDFEDSFFDIDIRNKNSIELTAERKKAVSTFLDFTKGKPAPWIYLTGAPRTGRSYLSAGLCVYAANKDLGPIAFINCAKRFKELNDLNYKDNDEFNEILSSYCQVPILVLDDFGNELKNDFVRDGILFPIINERIHHNLYTIFTSDFTIQDVVELYSVNKASAVRAKQIGRLITSKCETEIDLKTIAVH